MSDSVQPHRWQPTRLTCPWDSPGKNTGVGCHFLLQCIKVKSEVAQSCLTLSNPMDCSPPGSSVHGIFQARVLEWGAIAFSISPYKRLMTKQNPIHRALEKIKLIHTYNVSLVAGTCYIQCNSLLSLLKSSLSGVTTHKIVSHTAGFTII